MFGIGPMELVVIVVVALLIFGPQKLPEFARTIGKGLAEFRRASNDLRQTLAIDELQNDLRKTMNQATSPPVSRPAQAGDSLPPGSAAGAAAAAATPAAEPPTKPEWLDHPGQIPLGGDHDHHPLDDGPDQPDPAPVAPTAVKSPSAADSGLGNVPVGSVDPADPPRG